MSVHVNPPPGPVSRTADQVRQMSQVIQANVVLLRNAEAERQDIQTADHDIQIPSPAEVPSFREALIDPQQIKECDALALHLRLHESWGQFCLFCWSLQVSDPGDPPNFAADTNEWELRCPSELEWKETEIIGWLWRMRVEQRRRANPHDEKLLAQINELADKIPVKVSGESVNRCSDDAILTAGCEYAGMLGALRWIRDDSMTWNKPGIMEVDEVAFLSQFASPEE